jgi:hypothetical protein
MGAAMSNDVNRPNLNGPENIPLKEYIKSFKLQIQIIQLSNDLIIRTEVIDYGNTEERKWLGKITYWACTNGYYVETMSLEDAKKFK